MKYIGNKTRILSFIEDCFKRENILKERSLCDIFGGTGSVGLHFKKLGFQITSNDIMTYSYIHQYANVKLNKMPEFKKISQDGINGVLQKLQNLDGYRGYAFENYAPSGHYKRQYFSDANAMKIDAIRDKIEKWYINDLLSKDEYYILISSLINAADFVANISGTYGAYLKIWRSMALKPLKLLIPNIYNNNSHNEIYQLNANDLISKIRSDVLYIDPPYNSRQYAPNFHVLESLSIWDKQELVGKTGQRDYSNKKSAYCYKNKALTSLSELVRLSKSKYIVVSYSDEGIIPKNEIIKILEKKGNTSIYSLDYRRFRTECDNQNRHYKKCNDRVMENLFILKNNFYY